MNAINLSMAQIAQLTARVEGAAGYKRARDKEAAVKRFLKAAEVHGIAATTAVDILNATNYEEASNLVAKAQGKAPANNTPAKEKAAPKQERRAARGPSEGPRRRGARGKRDVPLFPIEGANPFRAGTQSGKTWEMMKKAPGKTFREYVEMGGRANTISYAIRNKWVRLGSTN